MSENREIDKIRDSGGQFEIGSQEDGAIDEMFEVDGRLIIVKEKSIYEYFRADVIDPERTNISLPNNIQRKVIDQGSDSELIGRTILTAKTLFQAEFFDENVEIEKALSLSFEILQEMTTLENKIQEYIEEEEKLSEEYRTKVKKAIDYSIPSIGNVETRCKTIFQKADHIEQTLMETITIFYPDADLNNQSHFPKFFEILEDKYGEDDPFVIYISSILDFMKLVRNLRNALDHRLNFVTVSDFELQPDSDVLTPTIELVNYRGSKLGKIALSELLPIVFNNLILVFENTIAFLSDKNLKPSIMAQCVMQIPEKKRKYKNVRYSFWSPLGEDGYFNQ